MKLLWFCMMLIPGPFLFHFYETTMRNDETDISYIFINGFLLIWLILSGILSIRVSLRVFFLMHSFMIVCSIILAQLFINPPNESWFNPFTMNVVILLSSLPILFGQLMTRLMTQSLYRFIKNKNLS
ncbi:MULTISPECIES: hypothetical protein [Shouchella]|uniref:Uncharacterized protein n=4 Tax=Bacillaceae TaxID=186817 RepID=A0A060LQX5_9BACI|nr:MULTISPECIES: hypothetical protein [Bacillaceae]RQW21909.1 hypothetical protein EH196_05185 [Bacillus sp. C1-1]AIC93676.1 hypothetical protein BleG1_1073 [Shouchella lehensis G1]KQL56457.1 hypothetical protein AN965_14165 [Alkalicoccobacillus plakortidis]MBG9782635.1 hypothetical protein [Shouchella lehensis]TES47749.1 hypothetical protein E2L03_11330 [Shouchella lehensis]